MNQREKNLAKMRKRNMRIYPLYRMLSWDYLFFYTINFLFLTQIKHISAANVVLVDAFYAIFGIIAQFPAAIIINFCGRKKSIVIANFINCLYMLVIIFSRYFTDLILAEILSSLAFAIKQSAEPSLLNESIPTSSFKDKIFAKINEKGLSGYYILNSITMLLSGWFFDINPYIPILLSLSVNILVTLLSKAFIEPIQKKKQSIKDFSIRKNIKELEESLKFILKSERLKSLLLFAAIFNGMIVTLINCETSLLEEMKLSSTVIGIIAALLGIIAGITTKQQEKFNNKFKNKSLSIIGITIGISTITAGILAMITEKWNWIVIIVIIALSMRSIFKGIYYNLEEKYCRNFANEEIDAKIYISRNFVVSVASAISGVYASFLLERISSAWTMIVFGISNLFLIIIALIYMKSRIGLKPEQYSEEETKYDELKIVK